MASPVAGLSLRCGDCGTLLRSVEEAQEHADLTSHANFSESTEAVLNLICNTCGKPCRSKTESDLHTKRTGHVEFTDKTLEAAKPIDLEASKAPAVNSEENAAAAAAVASESGQLDEMIIPEVDKRLLEELELMGFSTARATRALHYSGKFKVFFVDQVVFVIYQTYYKVVTQECGSHHGSRDPQTYGLRNTVETGSRDLVIEGIKTECCLPNFRIYFSLLFDFFSFSLFIIKFFL